MPALDSVAEGMSEVEYHAFTAVKFIVFDHIALDVDAGVDHIVDNIADISEIMGGDEVKEFSVPYHAVLYALSHTVGEDLRGEGIKGIAVADNENRLFEGSDEVFSAFYVHGSLSAD